MPTYEYLCTQCGSPLEVVQSIHEPSLSECAECGGRLRKLFGNVGVVFKGSGFYRTDNRPGSKGNAAASTSAGTSVSAEAGSSSAPASKEPVATGSAGSGTSQSTAAKATTSTS